MAVYAALRARCSDRDPPRFLVGAQWKRATEAVCFELDPCKPSSAAVSSVDWLRAVTCGFWLEGKLEPIFGYRFFTMFG